MRTSLVLLVSIVASATAAPVQDTLDTRLFSEDKDEAPASTEDGIVADKNGTNRPTRNQSKRIDETKDSSTASILNQDSRAETSQKQSNEVKNRTKKGRKHKAIFVDYPVVQQLQFPNVSPYDVDYNNFDTQERSASSVNSLQESNIFYIRLPPTPYMFVPGLGYISQPPRYSTANLRPQIPQRPQKPRPSFQQPGNPFIKLPIDFVSNGKPTSVYQWQKKPSRKPTDSPITNLDSLSAEFVSNGKPTSIYQWQTNLKPAKRPDDSVNNLNKGPYTFNGKPTSFFLLKPDGTSSASQPLRYPDYQQDNSYY